MNSNYGVPALPVLGWQVGSADNLNGVVVKFGCSTLSGGPSATTFDSPFFNLSPDKVRSLINDLERSLQEYESKVA
ncbi:phage domain protein [Enterobacter sp. Bisph1]|uniref:phage domain protein n=1 Tax=Enterobacter sp. Bisph1 TaxID=1274399 RepID=UPI00057BF20D|nr:phage domain protein [Enterobacter sp. Bisph1]